MVALSVQDDREAIEKVLARRKLDTLRVATGGDWQSKFGISEAIPATVVIVGNRVRIVHEGVLPDPVAWLEADLAATRANVGNAKSN